MEAADRMVSAGEAAEHIFSNIGFLPHIKAEPGDYVGEDGFLYCGVCKTRKEHRFKLSGKMVPCACKCKLDEMAREKEEMRKKEERRRIETLSSYSLTDDLFYDCTFEHFTVRNQDDEILLKRLRNYVDQFDYFYQRNKGLLLYGPPGTGKTFGAYCIANALMKAGIPVMITSIIKLTNGGLYGSDLQKILELMKNARLLILDDFGAERNTEFRSEEIFSIIDGRVGSNRPMIITSNIMDFKSETDIRRLRIYDRINKACIPLKVSGESRRKQDMSREYKDLMSILDQ